MIPKLKQVALTLALFVLGLAIVQADTEEAIKNLPADEMAWETTKVPTGVAHISKYISEVDCVTFLYQGGKFDFVPVEQ